MITSINLFEMAIQALRSHEESERQAELRAQEKANADFEARAVIAFASADAKLCDVLGLDEVALTNAEYFDGFSQPGKLPTVTGEFSGMKFLVQGEIIEPVGQDPYPEFCRGGCFLVVDRNATGRLEFQNFKSLLELGRILTRLNPE